MRQHYKFMNFAQVDFLGFGVKFCKQNTKRNSENGFMKQSKSFRFCWDVSQISGPM